MLKLLLAIMRVKKSEYYDRKKIRALKKKRLKKILKHVLTHSSFYKRLYGKEGITIDKLDDIELKHLPPIDKHIMMDNYDDFVCTPDLKQEEIEQFISNKENWGKLYKGKYQIIHTSGSSGKIGLFAYGPDDWAILKSIVMTRITKTKINPFKKNKLAFIGAVDGHYAGVSLATDAPKWLFDMTSIDINAPLDKVDQQINEFQPTNLTGYSSGNYLLAQEQLKGHIDIHPERILCSGDILTDHMRAEITKAFNSNPVNYYAASESIGMAADCDEFKRMHLFDDWHDFELVDDNMELVPYGKPGNLVLTGFYNYTQPLLRYKMNDELILEKNFCDCGWAFPVVKTIAGRREEFVWFKNDKGVKDFIHPAILIEFFVPGLRKFQFIQTQRNKLHMKAIISGDEQEVISKIKKRMYEILKLKNLDDNVDFTVEKVHELKNDPKTGKFKTVIPLE